MLEFFVVVVVGAGFFFFTFDSQRGKRSVKMNKKRSKKYKGGMMEIP